MSEAAQVQCLWAKCRLPSADGFHLVLFLKSTKFIHSEEKQGFFF